MDFFSDTQETASRFGDYIDDLHDVFRCNDVDFGAPEDFFAFARTLKYHSELRGDVLRVVKSVMEGEASIAFRTILTIIAVASGGVEIATSEREMSVPVKLVIESLTGVGAWSQLDADHAGLYSDLAVKETERAVAPESSGGGEAMEHAEENAPLAMDAMDESSSGGAAVEGDADRSGYAGVEESFFEKATSDSSVEESLSSPLNGYSGSNGRQGLLNDFGGSNTLAESLTRLELNSLQLKIYLDSIDQRISRMEPRLEMVAPLVLSTATGEAREEPVARFSAAIASEREFQRNRNDAPVWDQSRGAAAAAGETGGALAVDWAVDAAVAAGPQTETGEFHSGPRRTGPRRTGPRRTGPRRTGRRPIALPIFVGVAMLLLAAFLLWRFGRRETGTVVIHPVNRSLEGGNAAAGAGVPPRVESSVAGPQVAAAGGASVTDVSGGQGKSSTSGYASQGVGHAADRSKPSPKKSAQIPLRSALGSSPAGNADGPPAKAVDADAVKDEPDDTDVTPVPLSGRPVEVSSGVMAANLVSAPEPSYPKLASLTRTQGSVVMQAVISKDGTVEEVNVIKGHHLLRGAAKNAVRKWRYRPYKVDGVPVDVATTVSVDFSLHH
jgi:TonB family protein